MATVLTNRQKKLTVQVNEGTTASPTLKNRTVGTGYWINPHEETVTDEILYQTGQYFGALQAHTVNAIKVEIRGYLETE